MKKLAAIEIPKYPDKLVAAVEAADRVLGWGSTGALRWLVNPADAAGLYGHHVLVAADTDEEGAYIYEAPRLDECDWRFHIAADGRLIGWSGLAEIELSQAAAFAQSSGGHWVRMTLSPDGEVEWDVDTNPSARSWADAIDWYTREPRNLSPEEIREERIGRLQAAMLAELS